MAFEFSLAAVLRYRGVIEEREERLLLQIVSELEGTVEHLALTNSKIIESYASMGQGNGGFFVGHQLHAAYGEANQLIETRKELEMRIAKLEELRSKQRTVYEAARRNREVLSEMRQTQRDAHEVEAAKREQKVLDDHHISRRGWS